MLCRVSVARVGSGGAHNLQIHYTWAAADSRDPLPLQCLHLHLHQPGVRTRHVVESLGSFPLILFDCRSKWCRRTAGRRSGVVEAWRKGPAPGHEAVGVRKMRFHNLVVSKSTRPGEQGSMHKTRGRRELYKVHPQRKSD